MSHANRRIRFWSPGWALAHVDFLSLAQADDNAQNSHRAVLWASRVLPFSQTDDSQKTFLSMIRIFFQEDIWTVFCNNMQVHFFFFSLQVNISLLCIIIIWSDNMQTVSMGLSLKQHNYYSFLTGSDISQTTADQQELYNCKITAGSHPTHTELTQTKPVSTY